MRKSLVEMLARAGEYARQTSGCSKVRVGSMIIDKRGGRVHFGANRVIPGPCRGLEECQTDGHCTSTIHSEIDAIINARCNLQGAAIYVTRYPCENCARAIVAAGIKFVYYGRQRAVSVETLAILNSGNVYLTHVPEYDEEDSI